MNSITGIIGVVVMCTLNLLKFAHISKTIALICHYF